VPCQLTEVFTTTEDDQRSIKISVFQGDGPNITGARSLGAYEVMLNESAPRGVPQIGVTFAVGTDGVFRLRARDAAGRDLRITTGFRP
jgi:molecular chaperone DnaK